LLEADELLLVPSYSLAILPLPYRAVEPGVAVFTHVLADDVSSNY